MFKHGKICACSFVLLFGLWSCSQNAEQTSQTEQPTKTEQPAQAESIANAEAIAAAEAAAKNEYVCPMRCEGSGQNEPGTCPVCKMLLVRSVEVEDFDPDNAKHTEASVYNLDANWVTQNGDEIQLENLSEDYQLVCMIFTACPEACPNLIGDMTKIDEALEPETKDKLKYLLVTIDPDNDTPERLTQFAELHNLDPDQWTLLRGEKDKIRSLSNMLGVEYKQYENGTFGHTNYLTLLNKKGEIIYRLHGIHVDNDDMLAFMHEHI